MQRYLKLTLFTHNNKSALNSKQILYRPLSLMAKPNVDQIFFFILSMTESIYSENIECRDSLISV